jgi:hypothetical protein
MLWIYSTTSSEKKGNLLMLGKRTGDGLEGAIEPNEGRVCSRMSFVNYFDQ